MPSVNLFGQPLSQVRQQARLEIVELAKEYVQSLGESALATTGGPLIITGHQPELFHPGVWIKYFATHRVAQLVGGRRSTSSSTTTP